MNNFIDSVVRKRSIALRLFATVGAFSMAQAVYAQDVASSSATAPAAANDKDATSQSGLADIIVTARKRAENVQSVPITIATISPTRLTETATRNLSDLSSITPGLQIQANTVVNPASSFIHLRGFSQTDDLIGFDQPVSVYVDNVYVDGVGGLGGQNFYDLDRVEVLKGPQGTLFGRNSVGGAIQIFTKEPTDKLEGEMLGGLGNRDGARLAGFVNVPLSDKAQLRVTGQYEDVGGWMRSAIDGSVSGGQKNYLARAALKLEPTDRLHMILRSSYSRIVAFGTPLRLRYVDPNGPAFLEGLFETGGTAAQTTAAFAQITNAPKYVNYSTANQPQVVNIYLESGEASYDLSDNVSLKYLAGYRHLDSHSYTDGDGTQFAILTSPQHRSTHELSQELTLSVKALDNRLNLVLGGYYYHFKGAEFQQSEALVALQSLFNPNGRTSTTIPHLTRDAPAVYSQATFAVTPTVNITGGVRYTSDKQVQTATGTVYADYALTMPTACNIPLTTTIPCSNTYRNKNTAATWLGSVDWKPIEGTMVYAKAARGFHSGGITPRLSPDPATATPFKPEYVTEFEVGQKSEFFDRKLRLNTSFYYDKFTGAQIVVPTLLPTGFDDLIENVGKANLYGVDMEVEAAPTERLHLGGTLGYEHGKFTQVNIYDSITNTTVNAASAYVIDNLPTWTYSLFGNYTMPTSFGSISGSLSWRWSSKQSLNPSKVRGPETFPASLVGIPGFAEGVSDQYQYQNAYGLLGGQLKMHIDSADVDVSLWGKNLLNRYYFAASSDLVRPGLGIVAATVGQPRTYGLEVTKRF